MVAGAGPVDAAAALTDRRFAQKVSGSVLTTLGYQRAVSTDAPHDCRECGVRVNIDSSGRGEYPKFYVELAQRLHCHYRRFTLCSLFGHDVFVVRNHHIGDGPEVVNHAGDLSRRIKIEGRCAVPVPSLHIATCITGLGLTDTQTPGGTERRCR